MPGDAFPRVDAKGCLAEGRLGPVETADRMICRRRRLIAQAGKEVEMRPTDSREDVISVEPREWDLGFGRIARHHGERREVVASRIAERVNQLHETSAIGPFDSRPALGDYLSVGRTDGLSPVSLSRFDPEARQRWERDRDPARMAEETRQDLADEHREHRRRARRQEVEAVEIPAINDDMD